MEWRRQHGSTRARCGPLILFFFRDEGTQFSRLVVKWLVCMHVVVYGCVMHVVVCGNICMGFDVYVCGISRQNYLKGGRM